jgi:hypothetical protein
MVFLGAVPTRHPACSRSTRDPNVIYAAFGVLRVTD